MHTLLLCLGLAIGVEQQGLNANPPVRPPVIVEREPIYYPIEVYCCPRPALQGYEYETHRPMAQTTAGYVQLFGI